MNATLTRRLGTLRRRWRMLLRLSLATSVAFFVATNVLGHQQAFFAPIAAVIVLIAGTGLRRRILVELIFGVAVGVLIGELLVLSIGRGAWQMALIVVLTVTTAILLGLKGLALTQAANSSVLLAAVVPVAGTGNPALSRFIDAMVGGVVGLVTIMLIPRNAVRDLDREVQEVLHDLAAILARLGTALRTMDADRAASELERAREMTPSVEAMAATAASASEVARLSPVRWRQRARVRSYVATIADLDNAVRDTRVLARRISSMLRHREPVPAGLDQALDELSNAFELFAEGLTAEFEFVAVRTALVNAARLAVTALTGGAMTINTATIAAQIRSLSADLLLASGLSLEEIDVALDFDTDD